MLIFCISVQNQTDNILVNIDANLIMIHDYIDNFQNIKVYKKNKNKNSWIKIDG